MCSNASFQDVYACLKDFHLVFDRLRPERQCGRHRSSLLECHPLRGHSISLPLVGAAERTRTSAFVRSIHFVPSDLPSPAPLITTFPYEVPASPSSRGVLMRD